MVEYITAWLGRNVLALTLPGSSCIFGLLCPLTLTPQVVYAFLDMICHCMTLKECFSINPPRQYMHFWSFDVNPPGSLCIFGYDMSLHGFEGMF